MSAESWLKRASSLILPKAERDICKFRFGVTDSEKSCCAEELPPVTCGCCLNSTAPPGWTVTISGVPVQNYQTGATSDMNRSHILGAVPGAACLWSTDHSDCTELWRVGDCNCTGHVTLQLAGRTITVKAWAFDVRKQWSYTFPGTDPIDCMAIKGLSFGNCTVSARSTNCNTMYRGWFSGRPESCLDWDTWISLPLTAYSGDYVEWQHLPSAFKVKIELGDGSYNTFILSPHARALCSGLMYNELWYIYRGWGPGCSPDGGGVCLDNQPVDTFTTAVNPLADPGGSSGLMLEIDAGGANAPFLSGGWFGGGEGSSGCYSIPHEIIESDNIWDDPYMCTEGPVHYTWKRDTINTGTPPPGYIYSPYPDGADVTCEPLI